MKSTRRSRYATSALLILSLLTPFASTISQANSQTKYLKPSAPISLSIPTINVTTGVIKLGLDSKGALEVPKGADIAGWYSGSPSPGEIGPTIIVAHVDMNGKLGVFYNLKQLKAGDRIQVKRQDGVVVHYKVTQTLTVLKSKFPTQKIYGDIDHSGLRLITCGGKFDHKIGHYESNVVVFAKAVN